MLANLRTFRSELPKIVISIVAMSLAILSFFGVTEKYFTKDKIPSVILALISGITIAEILERWDLQEEKKKNQAFLESIEGELSSINNIAQLIEVVEGENFFYGKAFSGEWFSFYQGHHDPDSAALEFDWCLEIVEIVELGRLLYIEAKHNEKQEFIKGLGKLVEERSIIGHWMTCADGTCKKGEFLLQKDDSGEMLYGVYSASYDHYNHPFYNWILIKRKDFRKNYEDKNFETIHRQLLKAWGKMQPLITKPDISELSTDDLRNWMLKLEKTSSQK